MKFFESEAYYSANAPYLFTTEHFIFLAIAIPLVVLLPLLFRKASEKKIKTALIITWIVQVVLEIAKNIIKVVCEKEFLLESNLPIHLCSLFMYVLPFAIWGKGWIKQIAISFTATIGLFGGAINFLYSNSLSTYPLLTGFALHGLFYHMLMVFTALVLWYSGHYKPKMKDCFLSFIPVFFSFVPCLIVDILYGYDYMFLNTGAGTPLTIARPFIPNWLWPILMMVGYFLVNFILFYFPLWIVNIVKNKKIKKERKNENKSQLN